MPKHYPALPQHNGHLLCGIDLETTGGDSTKHEIIQIAFVPLDLDYTPLSHVRAFYTTVKPLKPELAQPEATRVHGLDLDDLVLHAPHPDKVLEKFERWYTKLDLAFDRKILMLAHNCSFEMKFLEAWFGYEYMQKVFAFQTRDSMSLAIGINDHAVQHGRRPPFEQVGLTWLSNFFGINNPRPHDAGADATAGALVYQELLKMDILL